MARTLEEKRAWYHKNKDKSQAYYLSNKERIKAAVKLRRQLNPDMAKAARIQSIDKERARDRRRYWKDPEKYISRSSARAKQNPVRHARNTAYYRTNKKMACPSWVNPMKILILYEKASKLGMEVDHIVPLTSAFVCGLHCEDNLQLLCKSENVSKGNRSWPDG